MVDNSVAHMPRRSRRTGRKVLALVVLSVATVPATVFLLATATALSDAPPDGPICDYEIDEGSGPAGQGTEELRWGWWPTKYCVADGVEYDLAQTWRGGLLALVVAPCTGIATLTTGLTIFARRGVIWRRTGTQLGEASPDAR